MNFKSTLAIASLSALAAGYIQAAIIAQQNFEGNPAHLGYTTTTGTSALNSGTVAGSTPNTSTWGVGSSTGLSFTTDAGSITFASINTLNLTDSINLSVRLAALSHTGGNGLDADDNFLISVSTDGGQTFKDQIQVFGRTNARWSFSGGGATAQRAYSTSAVTEFRLEAGGTLTADGYTNIILTGLPSAENLVIRFTATDNHVDERWLIDDMVVQTVPEPAAAALGALGSLMLLRRRR